MAVRKRTLFAFGAHFSTPDSAGLHPGYNYKRCALDSPNETYVFFAPSVVDILFILVAALPSSRTVERFQHGRVSTRSQTEYLLKEFVGHFFCNISLAAATTSSTDGKNGLSSQNGRN